MVPQYDIEYSLMREAQERAAALATTDPLAREIHLELADRYADRAWGAREARCEEGNPC